MNTLSLHFSPSKGMTTSYWDFSTIYASQASSHQKSFTFPWAFPWELTKFQLLQKYFLSILWPRLMSQLWTAVCNHWTPQRKYNSFQDAKYNVWHYWAHRDVLVFLRFMFHILLISSGWFYRNFWFRRIYYFWPFFSSKDTLVSIQSSYTYYDVSFVDSNKTNSTIKSKYFSSILYYSNYPKKIHDCSTSLRTHPYYQLNFWQFRYITSREHL